MSVISIEEAVDKLRSVTEVIQEYHQVNIENAIGMVLAEDIRSIYPQPPFDRSPLDGYAIRAEDTRFASPEKPVCLKVIDKIMAGSVSHYQVSKGTAVRIMTGAPIPAGADCVIRQEDTDYGEKDVLVYQELHVHDNFCDAGEDYKAGEILLKKGEKLNAVSIGLLASMGIRNVLVFRKPKIALFTSGDELAEPGTGLMPGKIYDSNRFLLESRLRELGFSAVLCGYIPDCVEKAAKMITEATMTADIIITTGAVSVGQADIMHDVIQSLDAEKLFWKVAVKPGSPVLAYRYNHVPVIALSGNPFGALVTFEMLVRPILAHLAQDSGIIMEEKQAVLKGSFEKKSPVRRVIRGRYEDGVAEIPKQGHASGLLGSLKGCNCFIDIQNNHVGLKDGDQVRIWLL